MLYNRAVRRILAIALAVLIGLPPISPLLALSSGGDPGRPACCRRQGKHRCMLTDMDGGGSGMNESASAAVKRVASASAGKRLRLSTVSERCPYGSRTLPGPAHPDWTLGPAEAVFSGVVAHPSKAPETASKRHISADRSRQKRGPPATSLV